MHFIDLLPNSLFLDSFSEISNSSQLNTSNTGTISTIYSKNLRVAGMSVLASV